MCKAANDTDLNVGHLLELWLSRHPSREMHVYRRGATADEPAGVVATLSTEHEEMLFTVVDTTARRALRLALEQALEKDEQLRRQVNPAPYGWVSFDDTLYVKHESGKTYMCRRGTGTARWIVSTLRSSAGPGGAPLAPLDGRVLQDFDTPEKAMGAVDDVDRS